MMRNEDALDLLLPDADAQALSRARDVARFLRLLRDDARRSRAPAVGVDLEHARGSLELQMRATAEHALQDLLRHHMRVLASPDSFGAPGEPELDVRSAWRAVDDARDEFAGMPDLPQPGEAAREAGARCLTALESVADEPRLWLWRARWLQTTEGPRAAERAFREVLAHERRKLAAPAVTRAALAGVAECLLDRGAVREARTWLGEHASPLSVDPRLRQLLAWTRLLLEDVTGARAAVAGLRPWAGPLPAALGELRATFPDWLTLLTGRAEEARPTAILPPLEHRADVGASVLVVLVFRPGHATTDLVFECAAALAGRREAWLAEREGTSAIAGEREQALIARALPIVEHAPAGAALRGVVGGESTRALALAPVLDHDGEVIGWLHLEFEHHLVPCRQRLLRWAADWRANVAAARAGALTVAEVAPIAMRSAGPLAATFTALVQDLGIKTAQRRWWGFTVENGVPEIAASGGDGQGFPAPSPGQRRGLARAILTGARIEFDEPDPRLAIDAGAASGVVLPLAFQGVVRGLLAVESSRRRDFRSLDVAASAARTEVAGALVRTAQFQAWHAERFGFEPWFDARKPGFRAFLQRLCAAARSRSAVLLHGPAGVGKLVLARWLHFESGADGPFDLVRGGSFLPDQGLEDRRARAAGGTLVLDDVERFEPRVQEELLRWLEGGDRLLAPRACGTAAARFVVTTRVPLVQQATEGRLRADLALRLGRLSLAVPPLAARRDEVPDLFEAIVRRFAAEEHARAPEFADEALAAVWRQSWPGNVRELENLAHRVVLGHPGACIGGAEIAALAQEAGVSWIRRIPSRHPSRADLLAALGSTQTAGGRVNKTRAALYLGWDPDTLVARLGEAGLADEVVPGTAWCGGAIPDPAPGAADGEPEPAA